MIVARTFSTTADTALVNNAVNMAVDNRTRSGPTILHADHGTQFTSWSFGENMRRWGLLGSFGTVGDCFDNAAMESFWARMQVELLNTRKWATTIELVAAMADYIDNFYNVERRHSHLVYINPTEFELRSKIHSKWHSHAVLGNGGASYSRRLYEFSCEPGRKEFHPLSSMHG